MAKHIQAVRGMHDILPEQTPLWHHVEGVLQDVLECYGYQEIRFPIVERTELFSRSIGEVTDIVEKEMYTFEDRSGDSLTLRPEGTAGCLRACIEQGLLHNQTQKLWYAGPMFRHERPQKGRYRQFYQLGVEAYGFPGPDIDTELILMTHRFWKRLGIGDNLQLQLNSLGTTAERLQYRAMLVDYFRANLNLLDEDSLRRLGTNPLRILDSKNPDMAAVISTAPEFANHLGDESKAHLEAITQALDVSKVDYVLNPRLVRGLDYYSNTVFEWVTRELGAQGTVCAGGRYDSLIEQLGARSNHAIGFALGFERLNALVELSKTRIPNAGSDIYFIRVGASAEPAGLQLVEQLREALPHLKLLLNCGGGSFKSQFKRADKSNARFALILGEDEVANSTISVKPLRNDTPQSTVAQNELADYLKKIL
ncbi:MAG: histidine--tRNA ligase [Methylococcales bacterium]